jgi:hypothetical protein
LLKKETNYIYYILFFYTFVYPKGIISPAYPILSHGRPTLTHRSNSRTTGNRMRLRALAHAISISGDFEAKQNIKDIFQQNPLPEAGQVLACPTLRRPVLLFPRSSPE